MSSDLMHSAFTQCYAYYTAIKLQLGTELCLKYWLLGRVLIILFFPCMKCFCMINIDIRPSPVSIFSDPVLSSLAWDQAPRSGKKAQGQRGKISVSEASRAVAWGGRKGGRAWRHAFNATVPWYQTLVSCSDWSKVFMLTDSRCSWQYHALSISRSYNSGKDLLKHRLPANNTNLFARLLVYPSTPRRAKNMPVICCKKKNKHSKYRAFLILSCDKLQSHLQSDGLISPHSKGTAL